MTRQGHNPQRSQPFLDIEESSQSVIQIKAAFHMWRRTGSGEALIGSGTVPCLQGAPLELDEMDQSVRSINIW